MTFGFVPALLGVLGLAAIAGLLYALQRLRVRHQQVDVETTLFWRQAIEESRARVLTQRFRHPWTYALLLTICSLLWLAFAGLRSDAGGERDHVVLLDGSAGMAHGDRFERAVAAAADYAAGLPADARRVVLCAGRQQTILSPGEEALLLRRRLAGVAPAAAPNHVVDALFGVVRARSGRPMTVCVVGDLAMSEAERALLPSSVQLTRLPVAARAGDNFGVTALGVRPAASGRWEAVDLLLEVRGSAGVTGDAPLPTVTLDDAPVSATPTVEAFEGGVRLRYADLPAKGQLLRASLPGGDALGLDDTAAFALPDRTPVSVAVGPGVPAVVRQAVASDPGLVIQQAGARVAVRLVGADFGDGLPALELSDPAGAEDAFLVFHDEDQDPSEVLDELYTGLGLQEIDAMAAAAALGRPVTMGAKPAPRRRLWVWRQLLADDYDFVRSRSFPLFVGLGVRWLAGVEESPVRVAVGEPVTVGDAEVVAGEVRGRSFGAAFSPRAAVRHGLAGGAAVHASLLDPLATGALPTAAVAVPEVSEGAVGGVDLVTILLVLALALLCVEWGLYRTSRIP